MGYILIKWSVAARRRFLGSLSEDIKAPRQDSRVDPESFDFFRVALLLAKKRYPARCTRCDGQHAAVTSCRRSCFHCHLNYFSKPEQHSAAQHIYTGEPTKTILCSRTSASLTLTSTWRLEMQMAAHHSTWQHITAPRR
jgi:hypothetical protein